MKALINVDCQRDFMPATKEDYENKLGGALAVTDGDKIVPLVNKLGKSGNYDIVIFTMDWHPATHTAFASQHLGKVPFDTIEVNGVIDTLWPDHCIQDTIGAKLHKDIDFSIPNMYIFKKGEDRLFHPYSGFGGLPDKSSGLLEFLKEKGITEVHIDGIATDYCVLDTALDSAKYFKTTVITDACRGIVDDLQPSYDKMEKAGIKLVKFDEL